MGASGDKPAAQKRFQEKERLPFPLLADTEHRLADAFGAWQQKSLYGRLFNGVARMTVLLDGAGAVRRVLERVKPSGHARQVLDELQALGLADSGPPPPARE